MSNTLATGLITGLALALAIAVAVMVVLMLRRRLGIGGGASASAVERVLAAHGAACCMEAIGLLRGMSSRAEAEEFAAVWFRIAPAIDRALTDCPSPVKALLRKALEDCARQCQQRAVAKALMDCALRC